MCLNAESRKACKDAVDKQLRLEGMSESLMFEAAMTIDDNCNRQNVKSEGITVSPVSPYHRVTDRCIGVYHMM